MQNAHERFGALEFTRRTKDTITRVRVQIDRAVLEPSRDDRCKKVSPVGQVCLL
jgi:hypothetical protein